MAADVYNEFCTRMMVPQSQRLTRVLQILCEPIDVELLLAMPGTVSELTEKTGSSEADVKKRIKDLSFKGLVFESDKPQGTVYRAPRHIIQLHDASIQWLEATQEFYDAWSDFMTQEYPSWLKKMLEMGLPSFMRVIPSSGTLENLPEVRDDEDVEHFIDTAESIAVVRCPCRLSESKCDAPVETCIQFDRGALYNIKRGTGRSITKDEARDIVKQSEELGLVHTVENRPGIGNVLCNCCTDCCAIIGPYLQGGEFRSILAPSRFQARVVHVVRLAPDQTESEREKPQFRLGLEWLKEPKNPSAMQMPPPETA